MKPKRKNQSKPRCKTCAVNLAALSDAKSQFNAAMCDVVNLRIELGDEHTRHRTTTYACELNMAEYLKTDSALREELLCTETLRQEVSRLTGESQKLRAKNEALVAALAHSDAERRKLERDVLAQRAELAKLQPFNRILGAFPARGPIA